MKKVQKNMQTDFDEFSTSTGVMERPVDNDVLTISQEIEESMHVEMPTDISAIRIGGHLTKDGATFRFWAPAAREVYLIWGNQDRAVRPGSEWKLHKEGNYFYGFVRGARDGDFYRYWVVGPAGEGPKRDPYARELEWDNYPDCDCILRDPDSYPWASISYTQPQPKDLILYQLHVGTFWSSNGTGQDMRTVRVGRFLDILDYFEHLINLNITGIQLLPIVEWQTARSMGYNSTDIFSAEMDYFVRKNELSTYVQKLNALRAKKGVPAIDTALLESGVNQLKALIDLFHLFGVAVFFDVVYNHLGGSFDSQSIYRVDFHSTETKPHGPYFQNSGWAGGIVPDYAIPEVCSFLVDNANAMASEYKIDGIRYDEVTVIDDHGGWEFCKQLTKETTTAPAKLLNIAEYWRSDKSWIIRDRNLGGAGFNCVWMDSIRDAVRNAISAASNGRSAWVNMTSIANVLVPSFGDSDDRFWRAVHCLDNHDLSHAGKPDKVPRIARLADPYNSRSWCGRGRSRVANAILLSAPGIPMIFMGQEILEDKYWSDNPGYHAGTTIWWQGLGLQMEMQKHLEFMKDFINLRRKQPGFTGRYSIPYQVHDLDRVLVLLRGNGDAKHDVVIVFSLNECALMNYEIGMPKNGTWYECFNGSTYDLDTTQTVTTYKNIVADGPARNGMPVSARINIPPHAVLVYSLSGENGGNGHGDEKMAVWFQRPADWAESVHIHYWNTSPVNESTKWPGKLMERVSTDWYVFDFKSINSACIVFNDGHGKQTADLQRSRDGWYLWNKNWSDDSPLRVPEIDANPRQPVYNDAVDVHLFSSHPDDKIYFTTDGSVPTIDSQCYSAPIHIPVPDTVHTVVIRAFGKNIHRVEGKKFVFNYNFDPGVDLRAPTIEASLLPGKYDKPISVKFTVKDDRNAPVTAYYTTDGTLAKKSSAVYVEGSALNGLTGSSIQISRNEAKLISFLVIDGAGNETRQSFTYSVGIKEPDFREETIYFLLTTRFYDSDPSHNFFCRDRIRKDGNGNPIDPHWCGDFAGLIARLDYIKDLGFTAVWITPPVENRSGLDYHGYHAYDWNVIDPRLESPGATYADLIREVHERGMKIVQDVVINHSSNYGIRGKVFIDRLPIKYFVPQGSQQGLINNGPYRGNLGNYVSLYKEDNDNPVAPDWFRERQNSDPDGKVPLKDPITNEMVPRQGYRPDRFFHTDIGALNPEWYHIHGFIGGGGWEDPNDVQQGHLASDCMDLNTENVTVKNYLIEAVGRYLDMGVDAIRIDTLKHMSRQNVLEYVSAWKARKPGLFVFGENLVKGTGYGDVFGDDNAPSEIRPWWYTRLGNDPRNPNSGGDSGLSVLDFSLFSTFRDNLSRGSFSGIKGILERDWVYGDSSKLVTFLQNHDVGPDNDWRYRYNGQQGWAAAAYNLLWTIRGIPCLYYGEEIEFQKGCSQDISGNDDKLYQTGRAYFGDHLTDNRLSETCNHPLFRHIQRLNQIRKSIPALQKAPMSNIDEWGSGMRFVRDFNSGESYVVVGLAIGFEQHITVSGIRNGMYRDAVTGNQIQVNNGSISFSVPPGSAGIYVKDGPGKIGVDGVYLH